MKHLLKISYLIIFAAIVASVSTSCGNEDDTTFEFKSDLTNGYKTRSINSNEVKKHPLIEGHYVDFINNQYVINITKEEAVERGISEEEYDELFNSIKEGNRLLASIVDSCNNVGKQITINAFLYEECNQNINKYSIPRIITHTESETLPSGRITTTGQEYGRKTFEKVPINMVYVECNCYSNVAMLATQVVIAESWHMPKAATGIGQIVTLKTMFPVTNVPGEIRYATTDSNGGTCAWKGCKN